MTDAVLQNNNGGSAAPDNGTNPDNGSQPNKDSENQGKQPIDVSKLDDAAWQELTKSEAFWKTAFSHDRFKNLNEKAKKADEYETLRSKEEEARLREQKKFEELAQKKEEEATTWQKRYQDGLLNNRIFVEATKLGVVDPDAAAALIDRKKIVVNDDGSVDGVAEALKSLVEAKPYLVGTPQVPNIGGNTNPNNPSQIQPKFKASQLQDPIFFREHEKEIDKALKLGLIENDL